MSHKFPHTNPSLRLAIILGVVALASAFTHQAAAQATYFWRNEAGSGNWQSGTGTVWWNSGAGATGLSSTATVVLLWPNNNFLNQTNNTSGQFVHGLRFDPGANQAHSFGGGHLQFFGFSGVAPFIRNESSATHTFTNNMRITGGGSGNLLSITNNGTGGFIFLGNITNEGNNINVWGSRAVAGDDVVFRGVISGVGGLYKENENIRVVLEGANTYSGATTIQSGTVMLTNGGSLASSLVRIGADGVFDVRSDADVFMITERNSGDGGRANIGTGYTMTLVGNDVSTFHREISGGGSLVKSGNSTLTLYDTQTYTGSTTVNSGRLTTQGTMASKSFTINGGELRLEGNNRISTDNDVAITMAGGTLRLQSGEQTINGDVTLAADTSTISVSGGSENMTINGEIDGSGNLDKLGTGTLTLAGGGSYTGTTTVSQGTLIINGDLIGDGNPASMGIFTVVSGATLGGSGSIAGSLQLANDSFFVFDLDGPLTVNGTSVFFGMADPEDRFGIANLVGLSSSVDNGAYTIIDGLAGIDTTFLNNVGEANAFDLGDGKSAYFTTGSLVVNVVPEPSTWALLALGAGLAGWHLRRRRK